MDTKKCSKCGVEKSLECFSNQKASKDGLRPWCKECDKKRHKTWLDKPGNRKRVKERQRAWYVDPENNQRHKKRMEAWRAVPENKERTKEWGKQHRAKPEIRERRNKNHKERKETDHWYNLCENMRKRMNGWIRNNSSNKLISAVRHLGCGWEEFKPYLEARFYPHPVTGEVMSWENYGQWHLDHIYPLAKVDPNNIDQVKAAWHYTNYQPLWAIDNLAKQDKVTDSISANFLTNL